MLRKNPDYNVSFGEAFKRFWKNYANFSGRATRSEYWWWTLANFLITIVVCLIPFAAVLWCLVTLIPSIALGFRRLHDVGRSGAWALSPLLCGAICGSGAGAAARDADEVSQILLVVGSLLTIGFGILLFVWTLQDSQPGTNKYGQSEKYL